ncbi:retrovirus-related pol polyprotein from transposon TNT 1-94 [Tanacetum coccineum]
MLALSGAVFDSLTNPMVEKLICLSKKQIHSEGVIDEFLALGWLLEEIHMTWAHLEKKQDKILLDLTKPNLLEDYATWLETASISIKRREMNLEDELRYTKSYIPTIFDENYIPDNLKLIIQNLEYRSIHEGRPLSPESTKYDNIQNLFQTIKHGKIYELYEGISLRFLLEFYSSIEFIKDENQNIFLTLWALKRTFKFSLKSFASILLILCKEEAIREIGKKNLENDVEDETLEIDKIVNIKESRNHPLENVIETKVVTMQEELNQFIANDVWELVSQPKNMTIIGTKWVFSNKLDENGIVSRNKARLVAQGYNQQEGIDYDETYAPVARLESIRILLAYDCALDFKLFQMDVKSAFLNGFINEEVYVAQPPRFIDFEKPDHVYKLKKALYGLKQAPKAWYDRLKLFLLNLNIQWEW